MALESTKSAAVNGNCGTANKNTETTYKNTDFPIKTTMIIRTIESFYPVISGPANQAYQISMRLEKQGIKSPVYTTYYGAADRPEQEIYKGVEINRFKSKYSVMRYLITPDLKKRLQDGKFDLLHSHNYRNYQADIAYDIARKKNKPFIISTHGALLGYTNFVSGINKVPYVLYDFLTGKKTVVRADKVIVSSDAEIQEALKFGVPKLKIKKIPMGIDVKDYTADRKDKDNITALFVGRISRNRNLEPIIKAMKNVDKRIKLRIVGGEEKSSSTSRSGYIDELKAMAKNLGLENIEFAGPKYGDELINEYRNADVFVYTSLSENFGQTILEAGASGLPVICTPVGIANEIVKNNETGFIVDYLDSAKIVESLNTLLDFKKRSLFGQRLKARINADFGWDKIMMEYEKIYLDVLD
jgi:glycosyltransferase involved in cell wall biosynthesis